VSTNFEVVKTVETWQWFIQSVSNEADAFLRGVAQKCTKQLTLNLYFKEQ